MQETIFKPKYSIKSLLGVLVIISLEIFFLSQIYREKGSDPTNIIFAIFLGILLIYFLLYVLIQRIVFGPSDFSVEKYLWPPKTIEYTDVIDMSVTRIKTRRGYIGFGALSNSTELLSIFKQLIEQGKINQHQIENKLIVQEISYRKALLPAGIVSLVLWFAMISIWPNYDDSFFGSLGFFLVDLLVFSVVYWMIKK